MNLTSFALDYREMVDAKTQRVAGVRRAHRPQHRKSNGCK